MYQTSRLDLAFLSSYNIAMDAITSLDLSSASPWVIVAAVLFALIAFAILRSIIKVVITLVILGVIVAGVLIYLG